MTAVEELGEQLQWNTLSHASSSGTKSSECDKAVDFAFFNNSVVESLADKSAHLPQERTPTNGKEQSTYDKLKPSIASEGNLPRPLSENGTIIQETLNDSTLGPLKGVANSSPTDYEGNNNAG